MPNSRSNISWLGCCTLKTSSRFRLKFYLPLIGVFSVIGFAQTSASGQNGSGPEQPVAFSHKRHLALSIQCGECHSAQDDGEHLSFPAASKCMLCHVSVAREKPA